MTISETNLTKCRMLFLLLALVQFVYSRECELGPFERNHTVDLEPRQCEAVSVLEEFPDFYREIIIESTNGKLLPLNKTINARN